MTIGRLGDYLSPISGTVERTLDLLTSGKSIDTLASAVCGAVAFLAATSSYWPERAGRIAKFVEPIFLFMSCVVVVKELKAFVTELVKGPDIYKLTYAGSRVLIYAIPLVIMVMGQSPYKEWGAVIGCGLLATGCAIRALREYYLPQTRIDKIAALLKKLDEGVELVELFEEAKNSSLLPPSPSSEFKQALSDIAEVKYWMHLHGLVDGFIHEVDDQDKIDAQARLNSILNNELRKIRQAIHDDHWLQNGDVKDLHTVFSFQVRNDHQFPDTSARIAAIRTRYSKGLDKVKSELQRHLQDENGRLEKPISRELVLAVLPPAIAALCGLYAMTNTLSESLWIAHAGFAFNVGAELSVKIYERAMN